MDETEARALREQIAALTAAVSALTKTREPPGHGPSIRELHADFEKVMRIRPSWKDYRNRLAPLVRRLGDLPADALTPVVWADHAEKRLEEPMKWSCKQGHERDYDPPRYPKPHTITIEFWRANQLLNFGVESGRLAKNPLSGYTPPKTVSQRETWLDEAAFQQLLGGLTALKHERVQILMRAFMLLCCDSMMRFNEARGLRRDRIRDGIAELSAKRTKNKKERFLGITPRTREALAEIPPVLGSPYYFANPNTGALYSESTIRDWYSEVCAATGIHALAVEGERVVIHTLRHSGASAADEAGASARAIQDALGHAFLATTEKYLHRHKRDGARALAEVMHRKAAQKAPAGNSVPTPTAQTYTQRQK